MLGIKTCPPSLPFAPSCQQCKPPTWCQDHGDCTPDRCKDPSLTFCNSKMSKCMPPPPPTGKPVSQATAQQTCNNYAKQTNNNLNTNNGDANSSECSLSHSTLADHSTHRTFLFTTVDRCSLTIIMPRRGKLHQWRHCPNRYCQQRWQGHLRHRRQQQHPHHCHC